MAGVWDVLGETPARRSAIRAAGAFDDLVPQNKKAAVKWPTGTHAGEIGVPPMPMLNALGEPPRGPPAAPVGLPDIAPLVGAPPMSATSLGLPETPGVEYVGFNKNSTQILAMPDVLKGARNPPKVVIVGSSASLPEGLRNAFDYGADGVFDDKTKTVYLSSGLSPANAKYVAYHEIAGHYGLNGSLGASYEPVLNRALQNPTVHKIAKAMMGPGHEDVEVTAWDADEAIAELAAAQRTGHYWRIEKDWGVKVPDAAKPGIKGMLTRAVQLTKRTLADLTGEAPDAFDDEQVHELIQGAWRYVKRRPKDAGMEALEAGIEAANREAAEP